MTGRLADWLRDLADLLDPAQEMLTTDGHTWIRRCDLRKETP